MSPSLLLSMEVVVYRLFAPLMLVARILRQLGGQLQRNLVCARVVDGIVAVGLFGSVVEVEQTGSHTVLS